jgi:hypothetical protein
MEFRISVDDGGEERQVIWSRHLDPRRRQEDGEAQTVDVEIPPGTASRILLETLPGPDGDGSWDLGYWGDLEFVRR